MKNKYTELKINVILLVLAITVVVMIYILGVYKSYSCSKLCISGLSDGNNYEITAKISYSAGKLSDTALSVLVNDKYESLISTNSDSSLSFRAPLAFGPNLIRVRYGNSNTSAYFFYTGGMIYMLLIPLSIILFFLLMRLSSSLSQRNKIIFYSDDNCCLLNGTGLTESLISTSKKSKRTVKGLPELVSDVLNEHVKIAKATGQKAIKKDLSYISKKIEAVKPGTTLLNCVKDTQISREEATARIFYENSLILGSNTSLTVKTPNDILSIHNVTFLDQLPITRLTTMSRKGNKIQLFLSKHEEVGHFSRLIKHFHGDGPVLLLLQTEEIIQPILYGV
jgi:hypothetical protein